MSKNITTAGCTKHVDVRFKYVNEYVEEGIVKIIFVRSNESNSDIFTKNLGGDLYAKHSRKMVKWADQVQLCLIIKMGLLKLCLGETLTILMKEH